MTQQKLHAVAVVEKCGNKKVWLTLFVVEWKAESDVTFWGRGSQPNFFLKV